MSNEAVAAVTALIELGMIAQEDIVKCLKKALSEPESQRTWVGLTVEDKMAFLAQDFGGNRLDAMDWAEERLKEKNT